MPVALAPCAATIRVGEARPRPRALPECRERARRPVPHHPHWCRPSPSQRGSTSPIDQDEPTPHVAPIGAAAAAAKGEETSPPWRAACTCGRPGIWLNDEVIEYYNRLLMTRENPAVRAYWLPTFFYPILVGRTQVERRKTHNFDQVKPFTRTDFTRPRRHGQHL